ncbi:MAG: nucleoside-diphosphate-sugar epimerase [Akkermansiaceae bacterium]|nr:nucleoside-diphosphate-sugar epimerase [Akkermansiaceae bacterium]
MKIVVIGGTGLIGKKVVSILTEKGHEVLAASPSTGVNTLTGEGLDAAFSGAEVVVDVANSPSFEDEAVLKFFETAGHNITAAEAKAGVKHHVALSVVGTDRMQGSGYFRAKLAQEALIKASPVPYTILHATQFFEFVGAIAGAASDGETIRCSPALLQPIAASDVSAFVAEAALGEPVNGTIEIAGPDKIGIDELVRRHLAAAKDPREVIVDPKAGYFGAVIDDRSLTPDDGALIGAVHFDAWLKLQG